MSFVKFLVMACLTVLILFIACLTEMVGLPPGPVKISGEEMFSLLQSSFPQLEVGKELFVTTGEYFVFEVLSYQAVWRSISRLPPCRFKACLSLLGAFQEQLHPLVGAGLAMGVPGKAPAWFVLFVDTERRVYGLDPLEGRVWQIQPSELALLLI